jgi:hypothetical protein
MSPAAMALSALVNRASADGGILGWDGRWLDQ